MHRFVEAKTWDTPKIITIIIAVAALLLSAWNTWDLQWHTDLSIVVGKQVRVHAGFVCDTCSIPLPVLYMIINYANTGGRSIAVFDTRATVTCDSGGNEYWSQNFESLREIPNFLYAVGETPQSPIAPVVVGGHSTEVRQYAFMGYHGIDAGKMPEQFSLEIEIQARTESGWKSMGRYLCNGGNVWRDLQPHNKTFKAGVLDLEPLS